jgi:hypothetical protein
VVGPVSAIEIVAASELAARPLLPLAPQAARSSKKNVLRIAQVIGRVYERILFVLKPQ